MPKIIPALLFLVLASCAKMPVQSLTLIDAIHTEGIRMHEINMELLNRVFDEKREKIDHFIQHEYIPRYLKEFTARIPEDTDYKKEMPAMIQSIVPRINKRRDKMQDVIERQRIKLVSKLNADFKTYETSMLKRLNTHEYDYL